MPPTIAARIKIAMKAFFFMANLKGGRRGNGRVLARLK
jgi:hypothetical protein